MGFPTSIQTFTTKQDGVDYPQASHVNLLQTEVTAVETAIINGPLAPASLTVTGAATVGSTLGVTGAATLSSTLRVDGDVRLESATGPLVQGYEISALADNGAQGLTTAQTGFLFIRDDAGNAPALYAVSTSTTGEISDLNTAYSPTIGTGSSTNIYISGGNLTVQNKTGGVRNYKAVFIALAG
jgi:hypothetical protein